jgi:hypothetical protein
MRDRGDSLMMGIEEGILDGNRREGRNSMKIQEHGSFRLAGLGGEAEEKKRWVCGWSDEMISLGFSCIICCVCLPKP